MAEDIPQAAIPEDEYQRGVTTNQFIDAAAQAQDQLHHFPANVHVTAGEDGATVRTTESSGDRWTSNDGWPEERARKITKELSEIPDSGLDYDAARKVDNLRDEANRVNVAHDTVTTNGGDAKQVYEDERIEQRLKGDNQIGPSMMAGAQELGAMARGSGRKYDIKKGEAMRGTFAGKTDINGSFQVSSGDMSEYVPFAPQHQEKAKAAMQSLAEKQMQTANEAQRADEVRAAKEVLGRAGVKIPKPAEQPPTPPADQLDIAA